MPERLTLDRVADLSASDREALRALSTAVYPPTADPWPGAQWQWSSHDFCIRSLDEDGAPLTYVGIVLRDATLDGRPVRVAGIGGVKTHPAARRCGLAGHAMRHAIRYFRERGDVHFGLLACAPHLLAYYGDLGWTPFAGRMLVLRHGEMVEFTFNHVMTHGVLAASPEAGTIDLQGPPW